MAKKNENIVDTETVDTEMTGKNETANPHEKVKLTVPRRTLKDEPNLFVAINGVSYLIPKGKEVEVPRFVADEVNRSREAESRFFETVDELSVKPT